MLVKTVFGVRGGINIRPVVFMDFHIHIPTQFILRLTSHTALKCKFTHFVRVFTLQGQFVLEKQNWRNSLFRVYGTDFSYPFYLFDVNCAFYLLVITLLQQAFHC